VEIPKRIRLLAAAAVALRHAHAAEHLGRGLELHGRDDRQQTENHQGEDDELFHGAFSLLMDASSLWVFHISQIEPICRSLSEGKSSLRARAVENFLTIGF
jgi:hypothetical protein